MPVPRKQTYVFYDKESKGAIIKMFQQLKANTLETKRKIEILYKGIKEITNGNFRSEKYSN